MSRFIRVVIDVYRAMKSPMAAVKFSNATVIWEYEEHDLQLYNSIITSLIYHKLNLSSPT